MKIKTWKAWHDPIVPRFADETRNWMADPHPVRIVPEATWKKVMAVVKAADRDAPVGIAFAMDHLREYLRKQK